MRRSTRSIALAALLGVALIACLGLASSAPAATGIFEFDGAPSTTQAGGHPNIDFLIANKTRRDAPALPCACDDPRTVEFHFPTGFIGNPHALPRCTLAEFNQSACPADSQVGVFVFDENPELVLYAPVYNMEPHPDQAGLIGFTFIGGVPVFSELSARTDSDYGLDSISAPIVHFLTFDRIHLELWGVPADSSHDYFRFIPPLRGIGVCDKEGILGQCGDGENSGIASNSSPEPYLQNPTTCGEPLTFAGDTSYYTEEVFHADNPWPTTTGCDQLTFNPSLTAVPTTGQADTASGIDIDLKVPQLQSPTTPSPSEIRSNTVTLPKGFSINPNAADGKSLCLDSETAIGTRKAATCPETSKIGTLTIDSSALPAPIDGAMYLGESKPGNRYRLILAADGFATHVKLTGSVKPDPQTGQLVVTFDELPQSPLQEFKMHLFGSERGLVATPTQCGTYAVESKFVPWDSALSSETSTSFFTIDSGPNGKPCPGKPRPFDPQVDIGMANPTAGAHTPFTLRVKREDGDQNLAGLTVKAPPGFAATLKGIPYCPQSAIDQLNAPGYTGLSEIASPSCPVASQVGTAVAGAGAGTHPVYVGGKAYLAGPYKGAPLSLVVVVPAISGPYDVGNVAVRAAISVDPVTGQVTAVSDPLPQVLEGVPLRTRLVQVKLDRPNFALNPTNCNRSAFETGVSGDEGGAVTRTSLFQVGSCAELVYAPKLSLRLTGGVNRLGHPAIHALFRASPGEANSRYVRVTLPQGELLDNSHIGTVCTRVLFAKKECPASSLIGEATVTTPLLDQPLTGHVYLRASTQSLPDLVLDLQGQIDIELTGRVDSAKNSLRTTFENLPDAPISSVELNLAGGAKGLLQNSESLCGATKKKATVTMTGQNGASVATKAPLQAKCGSKARHKRHHRRHHSKRKAVH